MPTRVKAALLPAIALGLVEGNRWFQFNSDVITSPAGVGAGAAAVAPPAGTPPAAPVQQATAPAGVDVNAIVGPVLQAVREQVAGLLAPIQQQTTALATQVEEMRRPDPQRQSAASRLFGGAPGSAPGVRTGEDPLTSRGYQYYRALAFRQRALPADQCKVELDLHTHLHSRMIQQGFVPEGADSILVPLSVQSLPGFTDQEKHEIRQCVAQGLHGFSQGESVSMLQHMAQLGGRPMTRRQALSQFDDTGLGVFLGPTQEGDLLPMLRNKEIFSRAGATELTLPPNGRLKFNKQTGAMTAYWIGENQTITASQPQTGYLDLIAKKLATLIKLPNELLMYGSGTIEGFLRADMTRVMALEADAAMLSGVGTTIKIKGLLTYAGIQTRAAGVVGTNGDTFQPEDPALMLGDVEEVNHDPESSGWAWVCRPRLWYAMLNKRADVYNGTGTVQKGEWLFDTNREDIRSGLPAALLAYPVIKSNQMPNNIVKGSGSNLQRFLGGIFAHWMIARIGVLEFATTTQSDTAFQTDQTWVRAIQHIDAGPRYENAFVYADSLLPTV